MKKGLFISLEGGEGSGKTSQIVAISEYLKKHNIDHIITREPGGISISEQIREVILNKQNTTMDGRTEALLYAAARRQHLVEKVIPALNEGKVVISDRFVDASLAYQGYARGLGIDEVMEINEFAIDGYMPDLTLFLDIDPQAGLDRIAKNSQREVNRLDLEALDFHNKVREGYNILLKNYPERIKLIDASKNFDEVFEEIKKVLDKYIRVN
ncbi:thymidylate kinase [Clostridium collagenovorans DSM 3089]|uniref:Thymidylate kinase n=1 Tax=Clostridium collagenovorans DSM 3089 TaxID=1121306 RepID=A0A1M5WJT2_9CLOT|nr:dTMP kinase [Clostridium collagenovorans]SHH87775.1 thymidylate kinase [Clostridium collagenovorans DSM 3089]